MKFFSLLLCLACGINGLGPLRPAIEQHEGLSPIPSKVSDAGFAVIGATVDAGLLALKVPTVPRFAADMTAAWAIRNVSTFGRTEGSGFMFVIGVYPPEFIHFLVHGLKHPSRRNR